MKLFIIMCLCVVATLIYFLPVFLILAGINKTVKETHEISSNCDEWEIECKFYFEALESNNAEAAKIHGQNMDLLNERLK
jgi:hypothetical protein